MSSASRLLEVLHNVIKMMTDRGYDTSPLDQIKEYTPEIFEDAYYNYMRRLPTNPQELQQRREAWPVQYYLATRKGGAVTTLRAMSSQVFQHRDDPNDRVLVFFGELDAKQVSIAQTQIFGEMILEREFINARSGILITPAKLTPIAAGDLAGHQGTTYIQHFLDEDLLYDPTVSVWGSASNTFNPEVKGRSGPYTRIISGRKPNKDTESDVEAFLRRERLQVYQLPKIDIEDPIAKWYGMRVGDIAEINRDSILPETLIDQEIFFRLCYRRPPEKKTSAKKTPAPKTQ